MDDKRTMKAQRKKTREREGCRKKEARKPQFEKGEETEVVN